jgi:hypothetical protein
MKLDSVTFDKFLAGRNPFAGATPTFDLRVITLITPAGLVQLAAACHALAAAGRGPLVAVDDPLVRSS